MKFSLLLYWIILSLIYGNSIKSTHSNHSLFSSFMLPANYSKVMLMFLGNLYNSDE